MNITFDLGHDDDHDNNIEIGMHADHLILVLPPAYFSTPKNTRQVVDRTYYSYGSKLTWLDKNHLILFIHDGEHYNNNYMIGNSYHGYVPLVHKFNHYNITSDYFVLLPETGCEVMLIKGDLYMVSLRPIPLSYHGKSRYVELKTPKNQTME
ncbi:uncharacterized protein LOC123424451 [Hordeum vulgare subsp. vulgare]|uniref:uncharacterized protein LOC123424451 n=1 Tax=Hordeum vulgare subsp. vulgare TaxID=112509 RepID=UPI001D1A3504|nr:uncharacterized protein LOC123424451 [Hordeum vulgare subsp. vulgare]